MSIFGFISSTVAKSLGKTVLSLLLKSLGRESGPWTMEKLMRAIYWHHRLAAAGNCRSHAILGQLRFEGLSLGGKGKGERKGDFGKPLHRYLIYRIR